MSGEGLRSTYDGFGRRLTEIGPLGTMTSTWDAAAGRRTRLTGPAGYWVGFERVATGQVSRLVMSSNDPLALFGYDGLGRRDHQYLLNGASATFARDPLDRLTQLAMIVAPPNNFTLGFTRNPATAPP